MHDQEASAAASPPPPPPPWLTCLRRRQHRHNEGADYVISGLGTVGCHVADKEVLLATNVDGIVFEELDSSSGLSFLLPCFNDRMVPSRSNVVSACLLDTTNCLHLGLGWILTDGGGGRTRSARRAQLAAFFVCGAVFVEASHLSVLGIP